MAFIFFRLVDDDASSQKSSSESAYLEEVEINYEQIEYLTDSAG